MSAEQMVRAWQERDLTPSQRLVLMDLADCSDREGRNAFRSEQTIADHCQIDIRTVKRAIKALRERGLLVIQELPQPPRRSTTYQLRLAGRGLSEGRPPRPSRAPKGDSLSPFKGDNLPPMKGDNVSPINGDNLSPSIGGGIGGGIGDISYIPPTPPNKEDPVDPVDPVQADGLLSLVTKFAHDVLDVTATEPAQHRQLARDLRARNLPHTDALVARGLAAARAERTARRAS